jgi:hypothetical protein
MVGGVIGKLRRWFASRETYMRAEPLPVDGYIERDLLKGWISGGPEQRKMTFVKSRWRHWCWQPS